MKYRVKRIRRFYSGPREEYLTGAGGVEEMFPTKGAAKKRIEALIKEGHRLAKTEHSNPIYIIERVDDKREEKYEAK